jgi:hypothetical protein
MPPRKSRVDEMLQDADQLPPEELIEYLEKLHQLIQRKQTNAEWLEEWSQAINIVRDRAVHDAEGSLTAQFDQVACVFEERWDRRNASKRKQERDNEIVRLRDQEEFTFGEVAAELNKRLKEQLGRDLRREEKMNYRSVQAAYRRAKSETN